MVCETHPHLPLLRWDTQVRMQCRAAAEVGIRAAGNPWEDEAPSCRARASGPCNHWGLPEVEGFQ